MYLVDTSVWVDFLRGKATEQVAFLETLLEEGNAFLCEVTYSEICFGARNKRQLAEYQDHFLEMPFLELPELWHREVGRMGHRLRKSGYKPFLADLMICLVAIHHQAGLLTTDRDFIPFEKLFGLKVMN